MSTVTLSTLERFHEFVAQQLRTELGATMSPEQALALWREREDSLAAIRAGLEDVEAGRTVPLEQYLAEFRQRHNLDATP